MQRLPVSEVAIGSLRVVQDVEIHRLGPSEVTILTDGRVPPGERLLLQIPQAGGAPVNLWVQAVEHRAWIGAGRVRQRVRLQVLRTPELSVGLS